MPSNPFQESGEEHDLWGLDLLQEIPAHIAPLKSWEKYQDRTSQEPVPAYFSESGAKGLDAALSQVAATKGRETAGSLVRDDIFIRSLLRLGLGWSSPFFRYNEVANLGSD